LSADDEKPPLDAALRHLAEQQRRSLTSHPTPQELAAYHAGELPSEAETRLLDHLAVCRECSDLLLDLSGFADLKPPKGVPELTDEQVEQDWQKLRAKMGAGEGKKERTAEVVPIRPAGPPRPERSHWLPVAASLLAVLGFSLGLYQSFQVGKLSRPRVVPVISSGNVERGESDELTISARDGALIYLDSDPDKSYPAYEAEVVREGEVLARIPVGAIGDESVPLLVPGPLKPGRYEVRLFGVEGDLRGPSTTYLFEAR
jgi:hypothetical protein